LCEQMGNREFENPVDTPPGPHLIAHIDRSAVEFNCRQLRARAGGQVKMCAAVKANAYGHGVECVLPALQRAGVEMAAVATIEEAMQVRSVGFSGSILLLGEHLCGLSDAAAKQTAAMLIEHRVEPTVMHMRSLQVLAEAAARLSAKVRIHVKVDTGMGRNGVDETAAMELLQAAAGMPTIRVKGLYTHFATSDEQDKTFAREQLSRFNDFLRRVEQADLRPELIHAANSGATLDLPQAAFDMIRPGISIYGYYPDPGVHNKIELHPAMKLTARLLQVRTLPAGHSVGYGRTFKTSRQTRTALVPIGYADGYSRALSNRGVMLVDGKPAPVIGRVSMDCTVLDVTDLGPVSPGDEVVVIDDNRQSPNSVENLARMLGTIPNEIVTQLGQRIQRVPVN